jgi:lipopolysaccharide/colanic/teichoic acid biosynthesis glycosyltransferase
MCVSVDASIHQAHVTQQMQANGTMSKLDTEQPLIPFGRSLRQLGIDELPQLFNVLQGNMSLIGPRPDVAPFESYKPWQRRRFDVLPGITGLWQVSGKNETTFEEMMRLDARYVDHRSMWLDMKIVLMTIPTVLGQWWLEDDTP